MQEKGYAISLSFLSALSFIQFQKTLISFMLETLEIVLCHCNISQSYFLFFSILYSWYYPLHYYHPFIFYNLLYIAIVTWCPHSLWSTCYILMEIVLLLSTVRAFSCLFFHYFVHSESIGTKSMLAPLFRFPPKVSFAPEAVELQYLLLLKHWFITKDYG